MGNYIKALIEEAIEEPLTWKHIATGIGMGILLMAVIVTIMFSFSIACVVTGGSIYVCGI